MLYGEIKRAMTVPSAKYPECSYQGGNSRRDITGIQERGMVLHCIRRLRHQYQKEDVQTKSQYSGNGIEVKTIASNTYHLRI